MNTPQPIRATWRNAVHLSHIRTVVMGGNPQRFVAACGATVRSGDDGEQLSRCSKCEAAERRMEAAR